MPDHKGFKLQQLSEIHPLHFSENCQKFSILRYKLLIDIGDDNDSLFQACSYSHTCFAGDYDPHLKACYFHGNLTACGRTRAHQSITHFKRVPCGKYKIITLSITFTNGASKHIRYICISAPVIKLHLIRGEDSQFWSSSFLLLSFTSSEVKILNFDRVLFYYYYYYFLSTFFFFPPYLEN